MAITLIIEDGTIVTDANTYVDADEARLYASNRGVTLSADDDVVAVFIISAMDYLEAQRARYQGSKVAEDQALQFQRDDVYIDGISQDATTIPSILKQAQMRLVIEANNGVDLMPTRTGGFITEDTVGPITTKYSEKVDTSIEPNITAVDALLAPLFSVRSVGRFLTTYRA